MRRVYIVALVAVLPGVLSDLLIFKSDPKIIPWSRLAAAMTINAAWTIPWWLMWRRMGVQKTVMLHDGVEEVVGLVMLLWSAGEPKSKLQWACSVSMVVIVFINSRWG
jgi:hypothetical protein